MNRVLRFTFACDPIHCIASLEATLAVACVTFLSLVVRWLDISDQPFTAPFIFTVAVLSNKLGLQAGLIAAVTSILSFNFFLSASGPIYTFNLPTKLEGFADLLMIAVAVLVARKNLDLPKSDASKSPPESESLPFTSTKSDGEGGGARRSFWDVEPSHAWAEDDRVGLEYGRLYVDRLRRRYDCPLLVWIVAEMVRRGPDKMSGVEAGFLHAVAAAASRAPLTRE